MRGSFWVLQLYDVCEEIQLPKLRSILNAPEPALEKASKQSSPEHVRFERPPLAQAIEDIHLSTGEAFQGRVKYFDYGVICVELRREFEADWEDLVKLSSKYVAAPELEAKTSALVAARVAKAGPALVKPYPARLSEDYYIIQVEPNHDAAELLASHGDQIAQIVRGELIPLSQGERKEVLQASMSYYRQDLCVVGWVAALISDTPDGAAPAIQLLEYANTLLLEFRYYDELLSRVLEDVYKKLEHKGNLLHRWRLSREAEQLNTIRLDITELTERMDTSIKFLSDMFYARLYRMAAERVGVSDYRTLVDRKLRTAGDLYGFMTNQFHQARAFVLEFLVVAILVIELVMLFRGK